MKKEISIINLYNNFNKSQQTFRNWIKKNYVVCGKIQWYPKNKECWFHGYKKEIEKCGL